MSPPASSSLHSHDNGSHQVPTVRPGEKAYQSEMMFVGERCHLSDCRRESFLPFRCQDCHHQFCSDHFKTGDHHCSQASATFLVPLCPLCHEPPKNWKRDEDPNIAMNAHLTPNDRTGKIECTAIDQQGVLRGEENGKVKQQREKKENECNERRCRKMMVVPIQCPSCHLLFCPSHRAPIQHSCTSTVVASTSKPTKNASKSPGTSVSLLNKLTPSTLVNSSSSPATNNNTTSKKEKESSSSSSSSNPLQAISTARKGFKTDKRARAEHASYIKAMQARNVKGLLSQAEQVRLAEEMAEMQSSSSKDHNRDCSIM